MFYMCLNDFTMCQRVAKVVGSFHTLPFLHLGTPVAWSFRLQPYEVVMPEAQGYIVSS